MLDASYTLLISTTFLRLRRWVVAICLVCTLSACGGDTTDASASTPPHPFPAALTQADSTPPVELDESTTHYVQGLEHLRQGDFAAAASAFDLALTIQPDDERLTMARGVAYLVGEQFANAKRDFLALPRDDRHAQLWNYAHSVMSKDMSGLPSVPPNMVQSYEETACTSGSASVPGHVIQGDKTFDTDYASHIIYEMASTYGERTCGKPVDPAKIDALLQSGARWFAHLNMALPELLPYQLSKATQLLADNDLKGASTYANFAELSVPNDARVAELIGRIQLRAGKILTARRTFTKAQALGSTSADSLFGRAVTARLANDDTAERDVDLARDVDQGAYARWEDQLDAAAPTLVDGAEPSALVQRLANATRQPTATDQLNALAQSVHQVFEPNRNRYDEIYERTVRTLLSAAVNNPTDADAWVALSRYVAQEADLRGEVVEKRRPRVTYRHQISPEIELKRALAYADRALTVDPQHTAGLMMRAEILNQLGNSEAAESIAQQVLAINPDDPQAAVLFAMFRAQRAANLRSAAAALRSESCSSSSSIERRYDGVYRVTRTTCTPPSQGERDMARAYDQEAQRLLAQSQRVMQRALELSRGTYEGHLLEADVNLWQQDHAGAARALRNAVALDPSDLRAHESLVRILPRLGEHEAAAEHQIVVNEGLQTTAAPLLKLARQWIEARKFSPAGPILERALTLDPQDARVPAYLGVVYEALNRPVEAQAAYRLVLALEDARLSKDGGALLPRPIQDYSLYLHVVGRLAALLGMNSAEAVDLVNTANNLHDRWQPGWRSVEMVAGRLPDATGAPKNGATVLAELTIFLGRAAQNAGQLELAKKHFQQAVDLGPDPHIPRIRSSSGTTNFAGYAQEPVADGMLGLMEVHIAEGNFDAARQAMANLGYTAQSRATSRKIQDLERQLRRAENFQASNQYQASRLPAREIAHLKSSLTQHKLLVGDWTYKPLLEWRLAAPEGRYRFNADGTYRFERAGRVVEQGFWGATGNFQPIEVLTLITESGLTHTRYPEQISSDHFTVTEMSGAKFNLERDGR